MSVGTEPIVTPVNPDEERRRDNVPIYDPGKIENSLNLSETEFRKLAFSDKLTGLKNRNWWEMCAGKMYEDVVVKQGETLSVAIIDVDHMGILNNMLGHSGVDSLLKQLGNMLKDPSKGFRDGDVVVRIGGEEIAVLMPYTDLENACKATDRVRENMVVLEKEFVVSPTISSGVASSKQNFKSIEELYISADIALSHAKLDRNSVVPFEEGMKLTDYKKFK